MMVLPMTPVHDGNNAAVDGRDVGCDDGDDDGDGPGMAVMTRRKTLLLMLIVVGRGCDRIVVVLFCV